MLAAAMTLSGCGNGNPDKDTAMSNITENTVNRTVQAITEKCPEADKALVQKGVTQAAALWRAEDGTEAEFEQFATESYAATPEDRKVLFDKLSEAFETLYGTSNQVAVRLQKPLHLTGPEPTESVRSLLPPVGRPVRQQDGICHYSQFPLLHPRGEEYPRQGLEPPRMGLRPHGGRLYHQGTGQGEVGILPGAKCIGELHSLLQYHDGTSAH